MSIIHKPGSIVGWPQFAGPTDFPDSPLSKALTQPVLYGPWHPLHLAKFGATLCVAFSCIVLLARKFNLSNA